MTNEDVRAGETPTVQLRSTRPIRAAFEVAPTAATARRSSAAFAEGCGAQRLGPRRSPAATEIARWNANENIGVQSHFEALAAMIEGDTTTVQIR